MMTLLRAWRGVTRRAVGLVKRRPAEPSLLEMIWPVTRLATPPCVQVPAGYALRQFTPGDREEYFRLLASAGMPPCRLEYWEGHLLPDGFYVIEHQASGALVATCMASHHPSPRHPRAGNFGWLAADPAHGGRGLGRAVSAAVTSRLIAAGYRRIYLETHDFRLAAIKIYLAMGWVPLLYAEDMPPRWRTICDRLRWPFTPDEWAGQETRENR